MTLAFGLLAGMWNLHNFGAVAICLSIGSIEPHGLCLCGMGLLSLVFDPLQLSSLLPELYHQ